MENSGTLMYAELLANIRQISVIAFLGSPSDSSTSVELSGDGRHFTLCHKEDTLILDLPGQIARHSQLQRPLLGSKELSWRLPLAGHPKRGDPESNKSPWSAASLSEHVEFLCRGCGAVVVRQGTIKTWKDLPSENWAEMMDFWHCHKPSNHESDEQSHAKDSPASRGYGANTKFLARSTVGFVDLTSLLLAQADCTLTYAKESFSDQSKYPPLVCTNCRVYMGHWDQQAEGYRLYKWRLKSAEYEPPMSSIIAAQLQSVMSAQASSRLILIPMGWSPSTQDSGASSLTHKRSSQTTFLNLWILSPAIRYSAATANQALSTVRSPQSVGQLAMKVFWKAVSASAAEQLMESNGVEEVSLTAEVLQELRSGLQDSAYVLPPSARRFQDWDVGLLDRFEESRMKVSAAATSLA